MKDIYECLDLQRPRAIRFVPLGFPLSLIYSGRLKCCKVTEYLWLIIYSLGNAILHSMFRVISLSILGEILIPIPVSNSPFNSAFKTAPGSWIWWKLMGVMKVSKLKY